MVGNLMAQGDGDSIGCRILIDDEGNGAVFIAGFLYANMAEPLNKLWFNALNLAGAVLLLISLSVHFNLAATVLEGAWGLIALVGLVRALSARRAADRP